jgi:phosphatidylethanolamine/phosphatidyl-N-methylethanolamine N-methyltransferase
VSQQSANFYNKFSVFYPLVDVFLKPQKRKLFDEINILPFGKLLEIGVGNGTHLSLYKTHEIICIDTSLRMLEIARKQNVSNIDLLQMNGETLLFQDESFDYVVLSHTIAVVDNPEKLLEESYRVLKPNGKIFILNHFTPKNWLKVIDYSFYFFSKMFHFKSVFHVEELKTLAKFRLEKEVDFGAFSYFKLLIYCKL